MPPALLPLVCAALVGAASAAPADRAPAKNPGTFVVAEKDEITSLDPVWPYDNASQNAILNLYDTLIGFDGEAMDRFVPMLATKVPSVKNGLIRDDGRLYRFPIRRGVSFHDGTAMTPEDVRYSLLRFMLGDRAGGPSSLLLEPILGVSSTRDSSGTIKIDFAEAEKAITVEGDEVVVRLARPFSPFLAIMARWSYVMSRSWAAQNGEWDGRAETWAKYNNRDKEASFFHSHVNGTGPFKLERWDPPARYLLLARNDKYWRGPAALQRVLYKTVPEFATRRLMLQAGDADVINTPRPFVDQLDGLPGVTVVDRLPRLATDPAFFFTFDINTFGNPDVGSGKLDGDGIPPDFFKDGDVRKGFAYAMDYDALLRDTFKGTSARAKGPVPPGLLGYDKQQPFYAHDLKKAEAHLRGAWGGKLWERGMRFTVVHNVGSENSQAACRILVKNLEKLNPKFRVDVRGLDWAAFLDRGQRRQLPVFTRGWYADYPDAHNFVFAFYHSQGRYPSATGYSSVQMDVLIEKAVREVDPARRAELYRRILRIGYDDVPSLPLVHPRGVYAMRSWVQNFYENPVHLGFYYYGFAKR